VDGFLDWYLLGVALGLGIAAGIPGLPRDEGREFAVALVAVVAIATGVIAALVVVWAVFATILGVAVGVFSYRKLARPAVPAAALAVGVLSLLPFLGYLLAALSPVLGERLRRRTAGRYAGLRVLAKD
jgi:hypothetical protein